MNLQCWFDGVLLSYTTLPSFPEYKPNVANSKSSCLIVYSNKKMQLHNWEILHKMKVKPWMICSNFFDPRLTPLTFLPFHFDCGWRFRFLSAVYILWTKINPSKKIFLHASKMNKINKQHFEAMKSVYVDGTFPEWSSLCIEKCPHIKFLLLAGGTKELRFLKLLIIKCNNLI